MSNRVGELQNKPPIDLMINSYPMMFVGEETVDVGNNTTTLLRSWRNPSTKMSVIASVDHTPHGVLLHVSIARPDRIPSWSEIKAVRDYFFPSNVDVMMVLPRAEDYVNIHNYAMHLWQMPFEWRLL